MDFINTIKEYIKGGDGKWCRIGRTGSESGRLPCGNCLFGAGVARGTVTSGDEDCTAQYPNGNGGAHQTIPVPGTIRRVPITG